MQTQTCLFFEEKRNGLITNRHFIVPYVNFNKNSAKYVIIAVCLRTHTHNTALILLKKLAMNAQKRSIFIQCVWNLPILI